MIKLISRYLVHKSLPPLDPIKPPFKTCELHKQGSKVLDCFGRSRGVLCVKRVNGLLKLSAMCWARSGAMKELLFWKREFLFAL